MADRKAAAASPRDAAGPPVPASFRRSGSWHRHPSLWAARHVGVVRAVTGAVIPVRRRLIRRRWIVGVDPAIRVVVVGVDVVNTVWPPVEMMRPVVIPAAIVAYVSVPGMFSEAPVVRLTSMHRAPGHGVRHARPTSGEESDGQSNHDADRSERCPADP